MSDCAKENVSAPGLTDSLGRVAGYLRLSLFAGCNYRCCYCVPATDRAGGGAGARENGAGTGDGERDGLTAAEILRLCRVLSGLGVDRFKITGGEPFLAADAMEIIAGIRGEIKPASLTVTTNGSILGRYAAGLAAIGVDGVNVSLNAMTQAGYERVTGTNGKLTDVLDNIAAAKAAGLAVKLNFVPLRGVNIADIVPVADFAASVSTPVRFIELMPIGAGRGCAGLAAGEVRAILEERFGRAELVAAPVTERQGNGPAAYLSLPGLAVPVGFIAAVSRAFCRGCDRLRLNRAGFLRTCLCHGAGADLAAPLRRGADSEELAELIRRAVAEKPTGHDFDRPGDTGGGNRETDAMWRIGG